MSNPIRSFLRPTRPWVWLIALILLYQIFASIVLPIVARQQLTAFAEERVQLQLDIGEIEFDLYAFRLYLTDLRVSDATRNDSRDILAFDSLYINLQPLKFLTSKRIEVESLIIEGLSIGIERYADGSTNLENIVARLAQEDSETESSDATTETKTPLDFLLSNFALRGASIQIIDQQPSQIFETEIRDINLHILELSSAEDQQAQLNLESSFSGGGSLSVSGALSLMPTISAELDLSIQQLALEVIQPYLAANSEFELTSAQLSIDSKLRHTSENPLTLDGQIQLAELDIAYLGKSLFGWNELLLEDISYSLAENKLSISQIQLEGLSAQAEIDAEGSLDISAALKPNQMENDSFPESNPEANPETSPEAVAEIAQQSTPDSSTQSDIAFELDIAQFNLANAQLSFTDLSLPLPFEFRISQLQGQVMPISNSSTEPAAISLDAQIGEFGLLDIDAMLDIADPKAATQIAALLSNIEMQDLAAYLAKFVGRDVESGKLDLDLSYEIENSQLLGQNQISLRSFQLGQNIDSPDALSLPIGMAIALLKNSEGIIDVELGIDGNLDDPGFNYVGALGDAATNLITKLVSSPFALLGGLVGSEEALQEIQFLPGSSELRPPEREKLAIIASALAERPQLQLRVYPTLDLELDSAVALNSDQLSALGTARADNFKAQLIQFEPGIESRITVMQGTSNMQETSESPAELNSYSDENNTTTEVPAKFELLPL